MKSVYYYLSVLIIFLSACHTNKSELETIKVAQFGDVFIYIYLYIWQIPKDFSKKKV